MCVRGCLRDPGCHPRSPPGSPLSTTRSVVTSGGVASSGKHAGDTSPTVLLPTLAPCDSLTITFDILAQDLSRLLVISSQSMAVGSNFQDQLSDDPETPEPAAREETRLSEVGRQVEQLEERYKPQLEELARLGERFPPIDLPQNILSLRPRDQIALARAHGPRILELAAERSPTAAG
jgi:hypothetical protein